MAISPDGRYIALAAGDLIHVIPTNDKERRRKGGFKFGMLLPLPTDLTGKIYNDPFKKKFSTPKWAHDGSILYLTCRRMIKYWDGYKVDYTIEYTGFGRDKFEKYYEKSEGYEIIGSIEAHPIMRTKEIV